MTYKQPIFSLNFNHDETFFATGQSSYISIQENPLSARDIRIIGPNENIQPFLSYIKLILSDQNPSYDPLFDDFLFVPQFMNSLHYFTYFNLKEFVSSALSQNAPIIKSKSGMYPLYIALIKDFKAVRDDIVSSLCLNSKKNPFCLKIIEKELIKMNNLGFARLSDLYNVMYQEVTRKNFPKFCESSLVLPLIHISDHSRIKIPDFFNENEISSQGISIFFIESYIPLDYTMGSRESIDFLTSISECANTEILRCQIILDIANYK